MIRNQSFLSCRGGASSVIGWIAAGMVSEPCLASFHFMQIEAVVAGVNGDVTAQAIQLRMRSAGQEFVHQAKLIAWDAQGDNPVVLLDFDVAVAVGATGARILVASESMTTYTDPPVQPDFVLTNRIPASYLAAGSITVENDEGTLIVWRVSWGGDAYMGSTLGALTNDDDQEFGPPLSDPLPVDGTMVVVFSGAASDKSTSNQEDYEIVFSAPVLTNNAGVTFTITLPDCLDPDGAGPDADGDGVRDACDECPEDPAKSSPGLCGCGISDADSDGDGIADCLDRPDADNNNDNAGASDNGNINENGSSDEPDSSNGHDGMEPPGLNANDNGSDNLNDNTADVPPDGGVELNDNTSNGQDDRSGSGGAIRRPCGIGVLLWFVLAPLAMLGNTRNSQKGSEPQRLTT